MLLTNWLAATLERLQQSRNTRRSKRNSASRRQTARHSSIVSSAAPEALEERALLTTPFFHDSFEDPTGPTLGDGTRDSFADALSLGANGSSDSTDHFFRTTNNPENGVETWTGLQGAGYWVVDDIDSISGVPGTVETGSVVWNDITITGKTDLRLSIWLGARGVSGSEQFEDSDYLRVQAQVLEVGPRDIAKDGVFMGRRDTGKKEGIGRAELVGSVLNSF